MIQFNLLPDIKMEYIKARRAKRNVILIAGTVSAASIALFALLFLTVNMFQKQHIENLSDDINVAKTRLNDIEDLNKILTIQNQLNNVGALHDSKPVVTRLYTYLPQIVPVNTSISNVVVDFELLTINFSGSADSLATINKFVDTLKFTTYEDSSGSDSPAFKDVVLTSFGTDRENSTYDIDLSFDAFIFDSQTEITLTVPKIVSTRSETEKPSENLFKKQEQSEGAL